MRTFWIPRGQVMEIVFLTALTVEGGNCMRRRRSPICKERLANVALIELGASKSGSGWQADGRRLRRPVGGAWKNPKADGAKPGDTGGA